jgi:hypothetical protein
LTRVFDDVLVGSGVRIITTPPRSPQAKAFAERYVARCDASASTICSSTVNNTYIPSLHSSAVITTIIVRTGPGGFFPHLRP